METTAAKVVGPGDGKAGFLGSMGVRFMIDGAEAGERFSLVEHPMSARALTAPPQRPAREDDYSFVIPGRTWEWTGYAGVTAGNGELLLKSRGPWHATGG